ncbi:vesicle-associated membrane protein 722 [Tanacetum coccineum]
MHIAERLFQLSSTWIYYELVPIAFLERVKEEFNKKYRGGKAATAVANSMSKEFGPKLKEQMRYCVDHPEEVSKLDKVKVMMENIEKVLDSGEIIELLFDKTDNLRSRDKMEVYSVKTRTQNEDYGYRLYETMRVQFFLE